MARPPKPRLPPAPRAEAKSYSVRVFRSPREKQRTLARVMQASGGDIPAQLKPKELRTFTVQASTLHRARQLIVERLRVSGDTVRSINRGTREFVVYTVHPEDIKNAPNL